VRNVKITEVRIQLAHDAADRLRAYCSVTFDDMFVVRDLKVVDAANGPFVAMPSRRITAPCQECRSNNHLRANFCNHCGQRLPANASASDNGKPRLHVDIAHPVNKEFRQRIEEAVLKALETEEARARQPGYVAPAAGADAAQED
jgi:stage V sporulation protein G